VEVSAHRRVGIVRGRRRQILRGVRASFIFATLAKTVSNFIGRFDRPAGFARAARGSDVDPNLGGVFYEITPTGTLTTLYTFSQENGGAGGKPVIATPAICPALLMP